MWPDPLLTSVGPPVIRLVCNRDPGSKAVDPTRRDYGCADRPEEDFSIRLGRASGVSVHFPERDSADAGVTSRCKTWLPIDGA